jgi:hypothetical protein
MKLLLTLHSRSDRLDERGGWPTDEGTEVSRLTIQVAFRGADIRIGKHRCNGHRQAKLQKCLLVLFLWQVLIDHGGLCNLGNLLRGLRVALLLISLPPLALGAFIFFLAAPSLVPLSSTSKVLSVAPIDVSIRKATKFAPILQPGEAPPL